MRSIRVADLERSREFSQKRERGVHADARDIRANFSHIVAHARIHDIQRSREDISPFSRDMR